MRPVLLWLALMLVGVAGCLHSPMPWSPDGSWIAYTVEVRPREQVLEPGWIFEPKRPIRSAPAAGRSNYRLWTTRAATNTSVLLEEATGPMTSPGWSPDGRALAIGRVVTEADRSSRFEVVILEGLTRRRVVSSRPLTALTALDSEASRLPHQAVVWSPDGRYLAVPQLEPMGLAIIRVDNGRTVNTIPDAFLPSWSPAGGKLAFYLRSRGHSLHYLESALGQPRHLIDIGQASQAPAWSRDGASIGVVARRSTPRPGGEAVESIELLRVRVDPLAVEMVRSLSNDLNLSKDQTIEGTSIAFDRDGENVFCSTLIEGQPHQIVWYHPRENGVLKKFPLIDQNLPVGSLSLSPDDQTLAVRVALADQLTAPAFYDLNASTPRARLAAPDDDARLEWIANLVRSARLILADEAPALVHPENEPAATIERPTILPLLTELAPNSEAGARLRRIGQMGRPLCDRPSDAPDLDAKSRLIFDEARLFFDYLREDYPEALKSLEALDSSAGTPERRLAQLTIRAQILINQGQLTAAKRLITFLDQVGGHPPRQIEWTGQSYRLTQTVRAGANWPRYLAESLATVQKDLKGPRSNDEDDDFLPDRGSALLRSRALLKPGARVPLPQQPLPERPILDSGGFRPPGLVIPPRS